MPTEKNVHFQMLRIIPALLVVFASLCHAQPKAGELLRALSQSPKIAPENSPLSDFTAGALTARVIVNLQKPQGATETPALADPGVRRQVREAVGGALDRVIASLNPGEIRITNRFEYIFGFSAEVTLPGLQELIDSADVLSVEKDQILEAHLAQGIPLMNASAARSTYNGSGLSIAICDTGIDYTHPMLGGGGFPNSKVIGGYDCGDEDTNPMDAQGHGTCCAGIAAGGLGTTGDYIGGVAYSAKLYAVKISYGSGGSAYTSDMIQGWEWCITHQNDDAANPILIISTSFGGSKYSSVCDSATPAMTTAAANAVAAGITIFASSGNDGYCDSMGWPACISHVISVGAVYDAAFGIYQPCVSASSCATKYATSGCSTGWYSIDSTAADMVTSYSNTASFLGVLAPSNQAYTTDIVGAGGYSSGSYYSSFGGTSAACPYAAGAAACLQSAAKAITGSFLTPARVRSLLTNAGDLITDGKIAITKPRVNLGNAVDDIGPTPTPTPTTTGTPPTPTNTPTITRTPTITPTSTITPTPGPTLYSNGPIITHFGGGAGGADASALQSALSMNTYGLGHAFSVGYRVADDFTISDPAGWHIDTITFLAYQTGSGTTSTITGVYLQIWNGRPGDPGSSVVYGDLTTNRMTGTRWSNIYRVLDTALTNTQRPVMFNTVTLTTDLPAGTYWLDWMTNGSGSSGPWALPITILGQTTTGNGRQYMTGWGDALDSGTSTGQGFPFVIRGAISGPTPTPTVTATPIPTRTPAPTATPAPITEIVLNGTAFSTGETVTGTFMLCQPVNRPFQAYAAVVLPDGSMRDVWTLDTNLKPLTSFMPALGAPFSRQVFSAMVPAAAPRGVYELVTGFFEPWQPVRSRAEAFLDVSARFEIR